ncbi:MAG: ATP-grasp domain-containing protein [Gammaproteobacteria bacterium]|nr:ATP-grasp domain-containing protein [Gammaproteobacteria bacterium]
MSDRKNIFVFGLDAFHRADLEALPRADEFRFHPLLTFDEATRADEYPVDEMLEKAWRVLEEFDGEVDAVISHWDFPSSVMTPILRRKLGHPGPSVEAALMCEHKYWSRVVQERVEPEVVPEYAAVDPFADDPLDGVALDYPFWLKPVTAHSSNLGFRIESREDFDRAIPRIRDRIHLFAEAVNHLCGYAEVPDAVQGVGGYHCIAEAIISKGRQCTLEGYRYRGELEVYGVIDTIRDSHVLSVLSRYQYPSSIPQRVQERMIEVTDRILDAIGFDNAPFNIEYYWDQDSDRFMLLEINGRISQSHCPLFALVDGSSHQQVLIDLALGKRPNPPQREGRHKIAAKFMMRVFEEGVVAHAPSEGDVELLEKHFPDIRFESHVEDGQALADMPFQDSYSFNIADVYLGGESQHELLEKYDEVKQMLPFEILRRPEIV